MLAVLLFVALAIPATLVTTIIALIVKRSRWSSQAPFHTFLTVGSIIPLLMIADGFYQSWPWPWYKPEAMQDGFPPGPWLLMVSPVTWMLCLAISYAVFIRREGYRDRP